MHSRTHDSLCDEHRPRHGRYPGGQDTILPMGLGGDTHSENRCCHTRLPEAPGSQYSSLRCVETVGKGLVLVPEGCYNKKLWLVTGHIDFLPLWSLEVQDHGSGGFHVQLELSGSSMGPSRRVLPKWKGLWCSAGLFIRAPPKGSISKYCHLWGLVSTPEFGERTQTFRPS